MLYRWSTEQWDHLRDTWDPTEWHQVLMDLGCDEHAYASLLALVQQGPAGRVEANRLLWQFMKPAAPGQGPFQNAAQVWQKAIRRMLNKNMLIIISSVLKLPS